MVQDQIENVALYEKLNARFAVAFEWLKKNAETAAAGRNEIDGTKIYANVDCYTTHDFTSTLFEKHERYIDIQYICSGRESIFLAPREEQVVVKEYSPERDIAFLDAKGYAVPMQAGDFMIIYPHELHQPGVHFAGSGESVRKIIVKVAVDE